MAVMPKISEAALDYIRSWGIDPSWIKRDGVERFGYYATERVQHWEGEFVRWPEGFDYDHLASIYFEKPKSELGPTVFDKPFAIEVREELDAIADMLISKNEAYGNSALEPVRVFSRASAEEQLLVRIDDKLSRLQRGHEYADDDTVKDLIGYLVLLRLARK